LNFKYFLEIKKDGVASTLCVSDGGALSYLGKETPLPVDGIL
jgi:hypothetical protein